MKKIVIVFALMLCTACAKESLITPELSHVHSGARTLSSSAAFFISPQGNDKNPGTIEAPFLTMERARDTMRVSSTKIAYLRAGVYNRTSTFFLEASDNEEQWSTYPGDAINSAVVNGNGIHDVIDIIGGSYITINGLTIQNYSSRGIGIHGGMGVKEATPYFTVKHMPAQANRITNNIVENGNIAPGAWDRAAIYAQGTVPNTVISNNVVRNSSGYGIGAWCIKTGDNTSGTQILNNVILNVCSNTKDGGAIYVNDRSRTMKGIVIKNNYIRDYGLFENATRGIYMDDESSNLTIVSNIISGSGTFPIMYHSGNNNKVVGNIIDLNDNGSKATVLYQNDSFSSTMDSNIFHGNVILSKYTNYAIGSAYKQQNTGKLTQSLDVRNNFYYNYTSGTINTKGNEFSDLNPITGDPEVSGWDYNIALSSPIYKSPINFIAIEKNWGPTGFIIPQTGSSPSCLIPSKKMVQLTSNVFSSMQGLTKWNTFIGSCDNNDWVSYNSVDFSTGYNKFTARIAVPDAQAGKLVEIRLGGINGSLIGTLKTTSTGSFTSYQDQTISITEVKGMQNIYIVFKGGSGIGNFEYFRFTN